MQQGKNYCDTCFEGKDRHRVQKDKYVKDRRRVQKDKDAKDRRQVQKDKYIGQGSPLSPEGQGCQGLPKAKVFSRQERGLPKKHPFNCHLQFHVVYVYSFYFHEKKRSIFLERYFFRSTCGCRRLLISRQASLKKNMICKPLEIEQDGSQKSGHNTHNIV